MLSIWGSITILGRLYLHKNGPFFDALKENGYSSTQSLFENSFYSSPTGNPFAGTF